MFGRISRAVRRLDYASTVTAAGVVHVYNLRALADAAGIGMGAASIMSGSAPV